MFKCVAIIERTGADRDTRSINGYIVHKEILEFNIQWDDSCVGTWIDSVLDGEGSNIIRFSDINSIEEHYRCELDWQQENKTPYPVVLYFINRLKIIWNDLHPSRIELRNEQ